MSVRDPSPFARPELSAVLGPADAAGRWPCPSPRHPPGSHEPSVLAGVAASTWWCVTCGDGGRARDLALLLTAGDVGRARRLVEVVVAPQVAVAASVPLELVRVVPLDPGGTGAARPVGGPVDVADEVVVEGLGPASSVGVLAALLGWPDGVGLAIDGRWWPADAVLEATGIGRGSAVGPARPPASAAAPVAHLGGITGPDAGTTEPLSAGHHLVRRSALVVVAPDGTTTGTPLGSDATVGTSGVVVGPHRAVVRTGAPVAEPPVVTAPGATPWTRAVNRPPRPARPDEAPLSALPALPARAVVARTGVGLVPTVVSVLGAGVAALVLHQMLFLVLAGVGAVATLITAAQQRWVARRARQTHQRQLASARADRARAVALAHADACAAAQDQPELAVAVRRAVGRSARLWERRRHHPDAGRVALGRGDVAWTGARSLAPGDGADEELARLVAGHAELPDVPVMVQLEPGTVVGIVGARPAARALARSMLLQLVVHEGPADRRVAVVTDDAVGPWRWVTWLPHAGGPGSAHGAVAAGAAAADRLLDAMTAPIDGGPGLVLVVDGAALAAARTSAARAVLAGRRGSAVALVVADQVDELPAACTHVVRLGVDGTAVLHTVAPSVRQPFRPAGAGEVTAAVVARALARFEDPERVDAGALPAVVALRDLLGPEATDGARLAASWTALGSDPAPRAPIGVAVDGVVELDLERDGPHALVAGTTGAGKSELLRSWVVGLAVRCPPHDLTFLLIDYKGGAAFDACASLPHVVGVVTDLDDALAERALRSLDAEVRRRERSLREAGAADLRAYRAGAGGAPGAEPLPRLVVVVDEFATLAAELPGFVSALVGVAQRGRSLGVHLVLATQRPAGAVTDDIRANTNLRVALRMQDAASSLDLVADRVAATFDRSRPGRVALRLGPGELLVAQTAHCTGPSAAGPRAVTVVARDAPRPAVSPAGDATALDLLVATVQDAHRRLGGGAPRRPWLDPLPDALALDALPLGTVGWVDDPDHQRRVLLPGVAGSGNLVVLGAGAATLSLLLAVAVDAVRSAPPTGRHVYVIATHDAARWADAARLPAVGAVVAVHERDRIERLAVVLHDELQERRRRPDAARPELVLIVDGLASLRDALEDVAGADVWASFESVLGDGGAAGIHGVVAVDRVGALPGALAPAFPRRWVTAGAEGHDAVLWGVAHPRGAGAPVAGRIVVAGEQLVAQVAAVGDSDLAALVAVDRAGVERPLAIDALAAHVDARLLPSARRVADAWLVPFGLADGRRHEPAVLRVHDGEHVLVAGPARAGKSTTLAVLVAQRRAAEPGAAVVLVARRGPLAREPPAGVQLLSPEALASYHWPSGPLVVAIDDADTVDDPHGALAALLTRPDTLVLASGRPEALRAAYGSWTQLLRRSRLGVLLRPQPDLDGDLLGAVLPRRRALASRPGHGYLVDDQGIQVVQVATSWRSA